MSWREAQRPDEADADFEAREAEYLAEWNANRLVLAGIRSKIEAHFKVKPKTRDIIGRGMKI